MKTKAQKTKELERGRGFLKKSNMLVLFDFGRVETAALRRLRKELSSTGSPVLVMKRRLLNLILKEHGLVPNENIKTSIATVFAADMESVAAAVYKFFKGLDPEKKLGPEKILGAYDLKEKKFIEPAHVVRIGTLPPREALLAQLFGMIAAPIKSLLYILDKKASAEGGSAAG